MRGLGLNPLRVRNRNVLVPKISRIFRKQNANYWLNLLLEKRVPATPVYTIRDVVEDTHVRSRKMIVERRGLAHLAFPVKFPRASAGRSSPAPRLGEHTSRILRELRYSREAIGWLKQSGAIR